MRLLKRGGVASVRRRMAAVIFLMLWGFVQPFAGVSVSHAQITGPGQQNAVAGRYYEATGHTLAPEFVSFFDREGGVPQFGYPVTEARTENGYLVQWTERQRLEWHPENAGTEFEVLLGLLGRELTRGLEGPRFQAAGSLAANGAQEKGHYFPETGQFVDEPFYSYWVQHGGLALFGYPISVQFSGETGLQTQWFERARFEVHPENEPANRVLLGLLGHEALSVLGRQDYRFDVYGASVPDSSLQIGLAQGGESEDPDFFANVREAGGALGPAVVRLDNIFNYYNIVQRGADGAITYSWDRFDRVLDGLTAMGKEPLICLSYMPETLSLSGKSRVEKPALMTEWSALVEATVRHVNIERKVGVRYWEVWNEPDQWSFWQASFPDYLLLYDATVQAVLAADPTAKIGGPGVAHFSPDHLGEFLEHEQWQVAMGQPARVDFISWHSYGRSGPEVAADIREARKILERFPQFSPEIFITEFSILQGGQGDTSANGYTDRVEGAIAFLASIESMQRERLDRALLFELKDGEDPTGAKRSFWGRWGVLSFDGLPKPTYYALKAYLNRPAGMLPVALKGGPADGSLGMMAFGSAARSTMAVWYTGDVEARVKIGVPGSFGQNGFDYMLFDETTNNPTYKGNQGAGGSGSVSAGDLVFNLKPNSLVIITSR